MSDFRSYLLENSLYTSKSEYNEIVADEARAAKIFLVSFVGSVILFSLDSSKPILANYIRKDGPSRVNRMEDTNNDMSLAIKIASEAGVLRQTTTRELTKFLYLLKTRKIKTVDFDRLRHLIATPLLQRSLKGRYKTIFNEYYSGKISIVQMLYDMRNLIRTDDEIGTEFKDIFARYRSTLSKAVGAQDDDEDDGNIITTTDNAVDDISSTPNTQSKKVLVDIELDNKVNSGPTVAADDSNQTVTQQTSSTSDSVEVAQDLAPDYDLTNPGVVKDHFIKMMKSRDAKSYLKSISSGVSKFPWELINPSDIEVADAYTENKDHLNINISYLYKLMPVIRVKRSNIPEHMILVSLSAKMNETNVRDLFGDFVTAYTKLTGESLYWTTVYDGNFRNKHVSKSLDSAIEYYETMVQHEISNPYDFINKYLSTDYKGGGNQRTAALLTESPSILDEVEDRHKATLFKLILLALYALKKNYSQISSLSAANVIRHYNSYKHNRATIIEVFGEKFNEFYDHLVSNNFYNIPELKVYELMSTDDVDDNFIYQRLKDIDVYDYTVEEFKTFLEHIEANNLYDDYIRSTNSYMIDGVRLSSAPFSQLYSVDTNSALERKHLDIIDNIFIHSVYTSLKEKGFLSDSVNSLPILSSVVSAYELLYISRSDAAKAELILRGIEKAQAEANVYIIPFSYITISSNPRILRNQILQKFKYEVIDEYQHLMSYMDLDSENALADLISLTYNDNSLLRQLLGDHEYDIIGHAELMKQVIDAILAMYSLEDLESLDSNIYKKYHPIRIDLITKLAEDKEKVSLIIKKIMEASPNTNFSFLGKLIHNELGEDAYIEIFSSMSNPIPSLIGVETIKPEVVAKIVRSAMESANEHEKLSIVDSLLYRSFYSSDDNINVILDTILDVNREGTMIQIDQTLDQMGSEHEHLPIILNIFKFENTELKEKAIATLAKSLSAMNTVRIRETYNEYRDSIIDMLLYSPESASTIIDSVNSPTYKNKLIELVLSSKIIEDSSIRTELYNDTSGIVPTMELNNSRLTKILEYNNINLVESKPRRKRNETTDEYIARIVDETNYSSFSIGEINATKRELNEDELKQLTIEYDAYNSGNHGDTALEIIDSFDVSQSITKDVYSEFKEAYPDTVMYPVFHGTGTVAASMILRYGFAIIDASDPMNVGRMLGNGIYFSNVLDKAAQYIGDQGFSRRKGLIGYVLEMEAVTGIKNTHFSAAGLGGDRILSPEWCVFDPAAQLSIKRAHKVKLVSKMRIDELRQEILGEPIEEQMTRATPIRLLKDWIKLENTTKTVDHKYPYVATFIFGDNLIPIDGSVTGTANLADLQLKSNVWIETSSKGIAVCIGYSDPDEFDSDVYYVNSAKNWIVSEDPVYKQYFNATTVEGLNKQ